jgi:hypothetical protein
MTPAVFRFARYCTAAAMDVHRSFLSMIAGNLDGSGSIWFQLIRNPPTYRDERYSCPGTDESQNTSSAATDYSHAHITATSDNVEFMFGLRWTHSRPTDSQRWTHSRPTDSQRCVTLQKLLQQTQFRVMQTIGTDVPVERGESASVQTRRECFSESGRQKKT